MNSGIHLTLQKIYDHLPLHAEEGGEFTMVNTNDLVNQLSEIDHSLVAAGIEIVQRLFCTIGLLDEQLLQQNQWRFVSFPASLLARSLLKSLMDNDQSLFSNGFWLPQDSASPISDQQRELLHTLESQRVSNHKFNAQPVRYVHVAWGLFVVDGKVLLRHREDKNRPNQNNYVLIGGRLSQNDLREAGEDNALQVLQSPLASENSIAIDIALQREINEEVSLDVDTHYSFMPWRTIRPYRAVEGAGANHALTEYRIHVYHIGLTQKGLFELYKNINRDEHLTWFTLDELAQAKTADGKLAYLNALVEDFESEGAWSEAAKGLPTSYSDKYAYQNEVDSITLPIGNEDVIEQGKTGKEKRLNIELTETQKSLLIGLKLIGSSDRGSADLINIEVIGLGWVKATDEQLCNQLKALAQKLSSAELPLIESLNENCFRLAVKPEYCFLSDSAYRFSVEDACISLVREALGTPIGHFSEQKLIINTSKNLAEEVKRIAINDANRRFSVEDLSKLIRRDVRPICNRLGLRTLVRTVAKSQVIKARYIRSR